LINNVGVSSKYPTKWIDMTDADIDNIDVVNVHFNAKVCFFFVLRLLCCDSF
jgi:hypothetical protein